MTVEPKLEPREQIYRWILHGLVGPAASRRAEQGTTLEWRRHVSENQRIALHEAAHAVYGRSELRYEIVNLTIVPNKNVDAGRGKIMNGCCRHRAPAHGWTKIRRWFLRMRASVVRFFRRTREKVETDQRKALRYSFLFCEGNVTSLLAARRPYRTFQRHAAKFVNENWVVIRCLADELEKHSTLDAKQIERILSKPSLAVKPWIAPINCEPPSLRIQ